MTDTDLLAFLTHFAATRDWATWDAIADAYADDGDEIGERVALEVKEKGYWPSQYRHANRTQYEWTCPQKNLMPPPIVFYDKSPTSDIPLHYDSALFRRYGKSSAQSIWYESGHDRHRALIDAMRRHYEQPQGI